MQTPPVAGRFEEWRNRGGETASQGGEKLEALRARVAEKLTQARKELADLKGAGEQTWRQAAGQFSRAMTELRQAYEDWRRAIPQKRNPTPPALSDELRRIVTIAGARQSRA
jgi:hypothetical protein